MFKCLILLIISLPILHQSALLADSPDNPVNSDSLIDGRSFKHTMSDLHNEIDKNLYLFNVDEKLTKALLSDIILPAESLRIIAVGDIMPGTDYPSRSYLPHSCQSLFLPVQSLIGEADLAIGNLEGVFSSAGGTPKQCKDTLNCYVFRIPDSYASCIREAGFDILGVANNHVNDFGYEGRLSTIRRLDQEGLAFAGFPERHEVIVERKGMKIGFCAFAPHTGTIDFINYEEAAKLVADLKKRCDLVIVGFHSGAEGKDHQHVTRKDEVFLGHNRGNPRYFAHSVIDAGADLVVGHGPHVVRAIEFYKGKLIAYSLGNFCTWSRFNLSGPNANAPALEVNLDAEGMFLSGKIHSFIQLGEGGPVYDPEKKAAGRIRELTRIDFPEYKIIIDEEGNISTPVAE
jgi:poly-gamma-glutamate capsule biosynthesis protein CapA/YwtB (metallophosphatase superfamily)